MAQSVPDFLGVLKNKKNISKYYMLIFIHHVIRRTQAKRATSTHTTIEYSPPITIMTLLFYAYVYI